MLAAIGTITAGRDLPGDLRVPPCPRRLIHEFSGSTFLPKKLLPKKHHQVDEQAGDEGGADTVLFQGSLASLRPPGGPRPSCCPCCGQVSPDRPFPVCIKTQMVIETLKKWSGSALIFTRKYMPDTFVPSMVRQNRGNSD